MFVAYEDPNHPVWGCLGQSSTLAPSLQDTDPRACEDACLKGILVLFNSRLQIVIAEVGLVTLVLHWDLLVIDLIGRCHLK